MLLKNGQVFINGNLISLDLFILSGKIAAIGHGLSCLVNCNIIDLTGRVILPGIIDPHVHMRGLEETHKENWKSGSMAAAAGGNTTIFAMPNTIPKLTTEKLLDEYTKQAKDESIVNTFIHFGTDGQNIQEINNSLGKFSTVKVFLAPSTNSTPIADDLLEEIWRVFPFVSVHCEGTDDLIKAINLTKKHDNKLYICHLATKEQVEIVKREKNSNIFVEVSPHHLFLNNKITDATVKPAIGSPEDQESLWQALMKDGLIDTIGSDHAPHGSRPIKPFGIPGLESKLPLLLDAYRKCRLTIQQIVELCSTNPAQIFGLEKKGEIKIGYDADLTVVDLNKTKRFDPSKSFSKDKYSPFDGWEFTGWPEMTIVKGKIVFPT